MASALQIKLAPSSRRPVARGKAGPACHVPWEPVSCTAMPRIPVGDRMRSVLQRCVPALGGVVDLATKARTSRQLETPSLKLLACNGLSSRRNPSSLSSKSMWIKVSGRSHRTRQAEQSSDCKIQQCPESWLKLEASGCLVGRWAYAGRPMSELML